MPIEIEELIKSAKKGDAKAQNNLGFCYEKGEGVKQDYEEAVYWLIKSAEQGYAYAQYNLGLCYQTGKGVTKDDTKAVYWYTKIRRARKPTSTRKPWHMLSSRNRCRTKPRKSNLLVHEST